VSDPRRTQDPQLPPLPAGWKVWFAVCAVLGAAMTGLVVWLIVAAVHWLNRH
jgi:hypothetical protein